MNALLIRNPIARHAIDDATLERVLSVARDAGWQIGAAATEHAGHATALARDAAARGIEVIVVHGGDGTLNEVANGIAGTEAAMAAMRGGTANVWAKETRCPKDPVAAMRVIVRGKRRRIDLGRANGRYFLLMAGIGLDAAIIPRVDARVKRRVGALAYIITGFTLILRAKPWHVRMTIDGDASESSLYWMLAGNTRSYGGAAQITHRAVADDGLLDIALMRRGGVLRLIADGVRVLLRRHDRSPNVRYVRARSVDITTPGIPVQLDGESHGATPLRVEVAPLALNVIVPADLRSPLFSRD